MRRTPAAHLGSPRAPLLATPLATPRATPLATPCQAERVPDVCRARPVTKGVLSLGGPGSLERRFHRQAEFAAERGGQQDRLVETAQARTVRVDGHGDDQLAASAGGEPAFGHCPTQGLREALFAAVLERVERASDGAVEGRAPFELEKGSRGLGRQPDRRAGRQLETDTEGRRA